jgi:hypothetical protein
MPNTVDDYGVFFETDKGQRVLANMLLEGGFFKYNKTEGEMAVENFLKTVLAKTGRYPIDGQANSLERAVKFVRNLQKRRSALSYVKSLIQLKKEH